MSPIRVALSAVAKVDDGCALSLAVKSRPALKPSGWARLEKPPVPVQLVMAVLDRVEFDREPVAQALAAVLRDEPERSGLKSFVTETVHGYLAMSGAAPPMLPVRWWWVVQHIDQGVRELWAWGRRYRSADGTGRELRLIRLGHTAERPRSEGEVAVAAYTVACGRPAQWPEDWTQRFTVRPREKVSRAVVADVDLAAGTRTVLFDGGADEAAGLYRSAGLPVVGRVIRGHSRRPGGDCLKCRLLLACDEVVRAPGLLGLRSYPRAKLRQVSISDLRYHTECPAQYRLRSLRLPKFNEYAMPARLGQVVHHVLEQRHGKGDGPCRPEDMPTDLHSTDWRWDLDVEAAEAGVAMLAHHPFVCPLQAGISGVAIEKTFVFHDTAAQALVVAKPDLVYRDAGAWVWRETKTTRRSPRGSSDVMAEYPQVALATAVLGRGLLGGPVDGARVELEILRPSGSDLIVVDPADTGEVDHARSVLRDMAQPWREDEIFAAAPGENCRTCPVSRWCPSAADYPSPSVQEAARGADREQPA